MPGGYPPCLVVEGPYTGRLEPASLVVRSGPVFTVNGESAARMDGVRRLRGVVVIGGRSGVFPIGRRGKTLLVGLAR